MSAGRSTRRRLERERISGSIRASVGAPARFVGAMPGHDAYAIGSLIVVVPAQFPDYAPAELREAIEVRRTAALTGRCRCGAERRIRAKHGETRLVMAHESDCVASDQGLAEIATRHGWTGAA